MIDVACAIIVDKQGRVLVTQRSASMKLPLKWEFPGGKIEQGESPEECLLREIEEELQIDIEILKSLPTTIHHYPDFSIRLFPFKCKQLSGTIELKEHQAFLWLDADDLTDMDWAAADVPVLNEYIKLDKKFTYRPSPLNVVALIMLMLMVIWSALNVFFLLMALGIMFTDFLMQLFFVRHFRKVFIAELLIILVFGIYFYLINIF